MQEGVILIMVVMCCLSLLSGGFVLWKAKKGKSKTPSRTSSSSRTSPSAAAGPNVTSPVASGEWVQTNITFYGQSKGDDNGEGFIGVDLFKLGELGLKFNGRPVYPIAVHHDYAHSHLFKVMEVRGNRIKPILGYVVDICDRKDSSCKNAFKNNLKFLVDIHKTGFAAAGSNGNDMTTGEARVIGSINPSTLDVSVWIDGEKTYAMCSCTSPCDSKNQVWKQPKDLGSCYKG